MKAVILFLAIATALPSTAAMASNVRQSDLRTSYAEPVERKAGCTACACCDVVTIAGIRIPVGTSGSGGTRPRD